MHESAFTRRLFLQRGCALASLAATVPCFIERSALGTLGNPLLASQPGVPDERVLVIVQLGGGNDGLNTVVPFGDDGYYRARPQIGIRGPGAAARDAQAAALALDGARGLGLHPNLTGLKSLYDEGLVGIVQGVGYPNPNRSHFTSMDIWQTGRLDAKGSGWVGRYFDNTCGGTPSPEAAIAIGRNAPLALEGDLQKPIAFESSSLFRWNGQDLHGSLHDPYDRINRAGDGGDAGDSQKAFLMRTALDAQLSSDRIRSAVSKKPLVTYPGFALANQLKMIAAMIRDGMPTRVYYASMGGFDTHGGQLGTHGNLMRQLGDSLAAFQRDLKESRNDARVTTMVFSEFGRRVKQNASGGTDHGTAAPMFLIGPHVRSGVLGTHPSLTDLDAGDLRHTVDFRSVYAAVLEDWLKTPSEKVLRGRFPAARVFETRG
ncbi:MAG: hypothetical protein RL136_1790 [Planctomycetota bacterium]|jgi:uncharacterized protein (DUF1501 family)